MEKTSDKDKKISEKKATPEAISQIPSQPIPKQNNFWLFIILVVVVIGGLLLFKSAYKSSQTNEPDFTQDEFESLTDEDFEPSQLDELELGEIESDSDITRELDALEKELNGLDKGAFDASTLSDL